MISACDAAHDLIQSLGANVQGRDAARATYSLGALAKVIHALKMTLMTAAAKLQSCGGMDEEMADMLTTAIGDPTQAMHELQAWLSSK